AYGIVEKATAEDPRLPGAWALPETCFRKASVLYEQKRFQDAAATLKKGIADHSKSDLLLEMQHSLGWAYFGMKDYTRAIELADSLIGSPTASKRLQGLSLLRANAHYELTNYNEAITSYSEVVRLVSDDDESRKQGAEALARIAWCHYLAGRHDEALEAVDVALKAAENAAFVGDLKFLRGQILYLKNDPAKALLEFLDVLANHKESRFHSEVGYRLGWSYFKLEQYQEAAEVWFTYALKYPDQDTGREAALMAGEATFKAGDFEQSLELFDHYITTYPQMPESESVLYRASVACYSLQKYDKMSAYLTQLIERFPQTTYLAEAYYWLGFAASVREQTAESERYFSLLVKTQPTSEYASDALYRLGKIYNQTKRAQESCEAFLRIVKEYPNHVLPAEMLFWLGAQLWDAKRYDDAFRSYASLWEKHPSSELKGRAQFEAGRCLMQAQKLAEAEALYRRMLEENQHGGYRGLASYGLAIVLMDKKDYSGALQQLLDCRDSLPDEWAADAGFRIGVCHRELGQATEAFEAFMRVAILYDLPTLSAQALWEAGQASDRLSDATESEKTYRELIKRYGETEWGNKARELLNARASQPVSATE
ncbi:MAG TPA: tetratricopeptide repeat protein, partial [bacterium]|nr:tetratricopeptide repeat protein [bacterium]